MICVLHISSASFPFSTADMDGRSSMFRNIQELHGERFSLILVRHHQRRTVNRDFTCRLCTALCRHLAIRHRPLDRFDADHLIHPRRCLSRPSGPHLPLIPFVISPSSTYSCPPSQCYRQALTPFLVQRTNAPRHRTLKGLTLRAWSDYPRTRAIIPSKT
jgi:hypothetical protein